MIYPNPAKDIIQFDLNRISGKVNIKIYNVSGVIVFQKEVFFEKVFSLNLSGFPQSIYFVRLQFDNNIENHKFIVK